MKNKLVSAQWVICSCGFTDWFEIVRNGWDVLTGMLSMLPLDSSIIISVVFDEDYEMTYFLTRELMAS